MRYVDSVLQPGETVRHFATVHWVIYLPGVAALLVAFIVWLLVPPTGAVRTLGLGLALLSLAGSLYLLARAWWRRFTTEYAVTDRRVIVKHGVIRRRTLEMNMDKVSAVDVDQSILGRILNYGDVVVQGPGPDLSEIKDIGSPIEFRTHIIAK